MKVLPSLAALLGLASFITPSTSGANSPLRLFEIGVTRFVRNAEGEGRVENGRLNALGHFMLVNSSPSSFTGLVPDSVLGEPLIYTEAWFAYGQLGEDARANFPLANNGAAIALGSLLYYQVESDPDARLDVGNVVNLSTRGMVSPGTSPTLIGGFVIEGQSRRVLIRAIGPSLAQYGVTDALANPFVTIQRRNTPIYYNGNWGANLDANEIAEAATRVGAFPLERASQDAALLVELSPGAYTASVISENPSVGGTALLEIYVIP